MNGPFEHKLEPTPPGFYEGSLLGKDRALEPVRRALHACRDLPQSRLGPARVADLLCVLGTEARADSAVRAFLNEPEQAQHIARLISLGRRQAGDFEPADIASGLFGLVLLGQNTHHFAHVLLARGTGLLSTFEPHDMVKMLGAARAVSAGQKSLIEAVDKYLHARVGEFSPSDLGRAAQFLAQLNEPELVGRVLEASLGQLGRFYSFHLRLLAWAACSCGQTTAGFVSPILAEVTERLHHHPQQLELNDVVHYLALQSRQGIGGYSFVHDLSRWLAPRLRHCSPEHFGHIATAYRMMRVYDSRFMQQLGSAAVQRIGEFDPSTLCDVVHGFAALGFRHDELLSEAASQLEHQISRFSNRQCALTAWSFATFEGRLAKGVVARLGEVFNEAESDPIVLRQMHMALVATGLREPGRCPAAVLNIARTAVAVDEGNPFERAIHTALRKLDWPGVVIAPKAIIEGIPTDFVVIVGDRRFVIECDGAQFHLTTAGTYGGGDRLQDRIFRRCGYTVVHILGSDIAGRGPAEVARYVAARLDLGFEQ